jgi:hypothetical protein
VVIFVTNAHTLRADALILRRWEENLRVILEFLNYKSDYLELLTTVSDIINSKKAS